MDGFSHFLCRYSSSPMRLRNPRMERFVTEMSDNADAEGLEPPTCFRNQWRFAHLTDTRKNLFKVLAIATWHSTFALSLSYASAPPTSPLLQFLGIGSPRIVSSMRNASFIAPSIFGETFFGGVGLLPFRHPVSKVLNEPFPKNFISTPKDYKWSFSL